MKKIFFTDIVANRQLLTRLSSDIENNTLSHAYILEGAKGSGRHMIAKSLAAALCCTGNTEKLPCKKCKNCEKILNDKSPDIITIGLEGERSSIGVDSVRFLKSDIYIAPNDLDIKMYIMENADLMTPAAQNAFLLSLEEPPSYVMFFLLCENSSSLLETVRSRAPVMRTEKVPYEDIKKYLLENEERDARDLSISASEDFEELLFISNGSIGYAKELLVNRRLREQIIKSRETAKKFVCMATSGRSEAELLSEIYSMSNKRSDATELLLNIQSALRDLVLLQKSEFVHLCFYRKREEAEKIAGSVGCDKLMSIFDSASDTLDDISKNANIRLSLLSMLSKAKIV